MLFRFSPGLLLLAASARAQFSCTLSHFDDEAQCLDSMADGSDSHCVWCNVAGFSVCVEEDQASAMEQKLPGTHCDRYSDTDDATDDDDVHTDDSTPVDTDDAIAPSDDTLPDDFWNCLQKKNAATCDGDCTWCDSKKFGFGLCMTGPTAESAATSDFYECPAKQETKVSMLRGIVMDQSKPAVPQDPTDTACVLAFLQDPTADGCKAAVDSDGNACEFCDYQGTQICLNAEQAQAGEQFGMTCDNDEKANTFHLSDLQDPTDTACVLAFLQDPTADGCKAAVDSDGNACEFCNYQGTQICLNAEQAQAGEQFGMACDDEDTIQDPTDTACVLAFLQDPTADGCEASVDSDGNACEFCNYQGTQICLNAEQAQAGEQFGMTCDDEDTFHLLGVQDPTVTAK